MAWANSVDPDQMDQGLHCLPFHPHRLDAWFYGKHTYQSLSCTTTINTKFSELFSPKRIYVKYKNAILSHAPFAHDNIRYIGIYFSGNFITTAKHVVMVKAIKYLGKHMAICLILACEKEVIYIWQNSILIFYINKFNRKLFTKFQRCIIQQCFGCLNI